MKTDIGLVPLSQEKREWFRYAYSLYIEELVTWGADYRRDDRGIWQPDYLGYWLDTDGPILNRLIEADRGTVGFILSGSRDFPFKQASSDYKLCELFLMREARGLGIARRAVSDLWRQHPGCWELEVLRANAVAITFWQTLLTGNPSTRLDEREGDLLFEFEIPRERNTP